MPKKKILIILAVICLIVSVLIIVCSTGKKQTVLKTPPNLEVVKLTDSSCPGCFKMANFVNLITQQNVVLKTVREVDINSSEGKALREKYEITKVPIMIITGEIDKSQDFFNFWQGYGQAKEKVLISDVYPPYRDLKTNEIVGLVDLTIIHDQTCTECYNTNKHLDFLKAEGVEPANIKKLDVSDSEAKDLMEKYSITKVPIIILSKSASHYKMLTEHWQEVGVIAADGNYIYTAPEKIGTYRDLTTNEIKKIDLKS